MMLAVDAAPVELDIIQVGAGSKAGPWHPVSSGMVRATIRLRLSSLCGRLSSAGLAASRRWTECCMSGVVVHLRSDRQAASGGTLESLSALR